MPVAVSIVDFSSFDFTSMTVPETIRSDFFVNCSWLSGATAAHAFVVPSATTLQISMLARVWKTAECVNDFTGLSLPCRFSVIPPGGTREENIGFYGTCALRTHFIRRLRITGHIRIQILP